MRNKLKQSKKCKDASCPSKDPAEVITLVASESSSSNDETPEDTQGSNVAAAAGVSAGKADPLEEQRRILSAKRIEIAPIFLRTTQHSRRRRGRDGELELQKSVPPPLRKQLRLSTGCDLTERKGSRRGQSSLSALHSCLEQIQTSNRAFPVRTVFSTLQRKARERLQDFGPTENQSSLQNHLKEKRKRGTEGSERVSKRLRSGLAAEGATGMGHCHMSAQGVQESTVKKQPRSNKLSRSRRLRQQSGSPAGPVNIGEPHSGLIHDKDSNSQSPKTSDILQRESCFDDVLWTDKYSPQHSGEVIGNSASVNKLQRWLKKWKLRADCDERRKMDERKQEENSNNSWDCGDFQGEAGAEDDSEEPLWNTMLITGPPGVGKTASVYACAQELGFKVFEVNCSSQRSGRHVLSQLKEATQSHLVGMSGKDSLKPTYLNNYSCTPKPESLPGKTVPLKKVTSTSKKRAAQNFGPSSRRGNANPATVTLANYFKMKAKADHLHVGGLSPPEKPEGKELGNLSPGPDQTVPPNKKTATSLILFEEVDVIFDEDVGFLAAIKTFMSTTKRPVILTTSDPSFRERFDCSLEEIVFKSPSAANVCSYLQLVGLAENVRLELDDVSSLLRLSRGDVRRCLLQLQLWVNSGGGFPKEPTRVQHVIERGDNVDSHLPQCDTGCTASMLGLHPVTQNQLLNLLKCQYWSEVDMMELLRLLAESWRGGVPLLYSNLELLLPIGAKGTSVHSLDKGTCSGLQSETAPSDVDLHIQQLDGNVSPEASAATDSQSVWKISRLSRRKHHTTVFDTALSSSLAQTPQRTSSSSKRAYLRAPRVAADCLDALTDFLDLMSYVDALMSAEAPLVSGSRRSEAFVWTGAEIKDGLLDEMGEEEEEGGSQERLLDIQAAVEGLGCHRCCWRVSEAWTEMQKYRQELGDTRCGRLVERLTCPASSKRQSLSFGFQPPCAPSVSQRRYELSRTVLGSKSFSLLGNRQAVSVDYVPALRYICRFQREEPLRCLNYLSSKQLGLSKSTLQLLAEDFP